jgi:hypothetical protein
MKEMGNAIRHYQRLIIDAYSHPKVINMEKQLGKNLLEIARLTLKMTEIAVDLHYELELQYSDQGNKIYRVLRLVHFHSDTE